MDPETIQSLIDSIGSDTPPTSEDLTAARAELVEALTEAASGDEIDLDAARQLRAAIDAIDAEIVVREEAAATEAEEAAALLDGIVNADEDSETEASEDADAEADADAEPEASEDAEAEAEIEPAEEPVPEPVAASVTDALRRRRAAASARIETAGESSTFRPVGPAVSAGATVASLDDVVAIFNQFARDTRGKTPLVRSEATHPNMLGTRPDENTAIVASLLSDMGVTAAGGICDPVPALHDVMVCGERGRPIKNALPSLGAPFNGRGGVRFQPAVNFSDFTSGITDWDADTDAAPGTAVKACIDVTCEEDVEVLVGAIVACATVGNFQARFNPEQWRAALDALFVAHDSVAEAKLFDLITASLEATTGAAPVTVGAVDGTARTAFVGLDKAGAAIRQRNRLMPTATLRFIADGWLRDAIRADLTRNQPGDDGIQRADAVIDNYFANAHIAPVWSPDITAFAAQAGGALQDFPANALGALFVEGSFAHVDGGTLDLGTDITDSTLNSTNDRQAFMETFEAVAPVGCGGLSLSIPVDEACVCPAGS